MCFCVCVHSAGLLQALVEAVSLAWAFTAPEDGGSESSSLLAAWSRGQKPIIEVTIKAFSKQLAEKVSSFL